MNFEYDDDDNPKHAYLTNFLSLIHCAAAMLFLLLLLVMTMMMMLMLNFCVIFFLSFKHSNRHKNRLSFNTEEFVLLFLLAAKSSKTAPNDF